MTRANKRHALIIALLTTTITLSTACASNVLPSAAGDADKSASALRADGVLPELTPPTKERAAPSEFLTLYPGVWVDRERANALPGMAKEKAICDRGPIDIDALVSGTLPKDTPGVGTVIHATEEWVRYNNSKYDPDNRVYNDSDYAKSLGYDDIVAFPMMVAHDDTVMGEVPNIRDRHLTVDLNHNITNYKPVYPGDKLYIVIDCRDIFDVTPTEGSTYRWMGVDAKGSVYNQKGELVQKDIFRTTRGLRVYADSSRSIKSPKLSDVWDAPEWRRRAKHTYTDQDWAWIKSVWQNEKRQGAAPLYWEDVKIGDRPIPTLDGPIAVSVKPAPPWGTGAGGSRTLRKEILDPTTFATMVKDVNGVYWHPDKEVNVPSAPVDKQTTVIELGQPEEPEVAMIHKEVDGRGILLNYMGRDYAIRHINNWMGDHGWLQNIRWSIMEPFTANYYGEPLAPANPKSERYLWRVPGMENKHLGGHGLTFDVAYVQSYVYDKHVENGDFLVDMVWWVEDINGVIWQEGGATIKLPSRRAQ
ncbi:MAG: hypothetical protein KDA46_03980 [Parvularculaceae bacterium]|nr:hypothetical protein [Parvularculaceae bacterium]